ncbi:aldehyde dehydrogenase family protein, partial [Aeromonas veronii]|uniref:aldehyde dehydrogenase family protein n=1 Tax=Aeromonas veronii TaxID=654 RepID=UPI001F47A951
SGIPLTHRDHAQRVQFITGHDKEGNIAQEWWGGGGPPPPPAGPLFYQPTILGKVDKTNPILQEEIFGPVAPLVRFETEAEAIAIANDTPYGLAAYFYGRDIARVWRVAEQLEYGMVGINEGIISTELAPFGGIKESGLGREGAAEGLEEYLETKYLCFGAIR